MSHYVYYRGNKISWRNYLTRLFVVGVFPLAMLGIASMVIELCKLF